MWVVFVCFIVICWWEFCFWVGVVWSGGVRVCVCGIVLIGGVVVWMLRGFFWWRWFGWSRMVVLWEFVGGLMVLWLRLWEVWWFLFFVLWSSWMVFLSMIIEKNMLSLFWCGKMCFLVSWWRLCFWFWGIFIVLWFRFKE